MARDESDREDLLREATALVERIELTPVSSAAITPLPVQVRDRERGSDSSSDNGTTSNIIIIGFRAHGAVSFFFDTDLVYQFNAAGELRRAFAGGLLFKAERGRLVSMRRVRERDEVQLQRRDLTDAEQDAFVNRMREQLRRLGGDLKRGRYGVVGQVPAEADVLRRVQDWLGTHEMLRVAATPRV